MNVAFTSLISPLQVALAALQCLGVLLHLVVLQHLVAHLRSARAAPLVTRWTPPRGRCLEKERRPPTWEGLGKSPNVFCIHSNLNFSYNPYFFLFFILDLSGAAHTINTINCPLVVGRSMGYKSVYHNICRLDLGQTKNIKINVVNT